MQQVQLMSKRPYLSKSVVELEAIYETSATDKATVDLLVKELAFRTTQKAETLKQRIAKDRVVRTSAETPVESSPVERQLAAASPMRVEATPTVGPVPAFKPMQTPPVTNKATDVLSTWTALEVLSPNGFKKEIDLVAGDKEGPRQVRGKRSPVGDQPDVAAEETPVFRTLFWHDRHGTRDGVVAEGIFRH